MDISKNSEKIEHLEKEMEINVMSTERWDVEKNIQQKLEAFEQNIENLQQGWKNLSKANLQ